MPKFLEDRLKRAAAAKGLTGERADRYAFGAMNNMGAMHGNKETAKGRAMETKHERDATKQQDGGHPNRMAGRHEGGLHITEHHRTAKRGTPKR